MKVTVCMSAYVYATMEVDDKIAEIEEMGYFEKRELLNNIEESFPKKDGVSVTEIMGIYDETNELLYEC